MRKIILIFLFLFTLPLIGFTQHPDSDRIISYTAETADKKYIFVMPNRIGDDYFVSDKYKQRGMYFNDGSTIPLWTVDWKGRVYLPNDGKHIIRLGRLNYSATYREDVFTFIAEGKNLKVTKLKI